MDKLAEIKKHRKVYYKELFNYREAFFSQIKFFYSSYYLQTHQFNKKINLDMFVCECGEYALSTSRAILLLFFLPTRSRLRIHLKLVNDVFKVCHQETVELFKSGEVTNDAINKLLTLYYLKTSNGNHVMNKNKAVITNTIKINQNHFKYIRRDPFNNKSNTTTQNKDIKSDKEPKDIITSCTNEIIKYYNTKQMENYAYRFAGYLFQIGLFENGSTNKERFEILRTKYNIFLNPASYGTLLGKPISNFQNLSPKKILRSLMVIKDFFIKHQITSGIEAVERDLQIIEKECRINRNNV